MLHHLYLTDFNQT